MPSAAALQRRLMVPSVVTRVLRFIGYTAIMLAGIGLIVVDTFPTWYQAMGWFASIGGGLSALGVLSGRWIGEYVGLPLLASSMFAFSVLTYRDTFHQAGWVAIPSVLLLLAYGVLLVSRWLDVSAVVKSAKGHARFVRGRRRGTG